MLELHGVDVVYRKKARRVVALTGVDFRLEPSDFVTVTGPSGAGKTTFVQVCGGLLTPTRGSVLFQGHALHRMRDAELSAMRNSSIGFVFQSFNLVDYLSALENVALPLVFRRVAPELRQARAMEVLHSLGLEHRADHFPSELSGGECQRVAIARALVTQPSLIIADEPTGNLDHESSQVMMDLLCSLQERVAVLLVTHNPRIAEFGKRIIRIEEGRLV